MYLESVFPWETTIKKENIVYFGITLLNEENNLNCSSHDLDHSRVIDNPIPHAHSLQKYEYTKLENVNDNLISVFKNLW